EENKPVYADAWANQAWAKVGAIKYLGNKVEVPIEITVPPQPDQTVKTQVTIRGNGKQQFTVDVSLAVEEDIVVTVIEPDRPVPRKRTQPESGGSVPLWAWFGCGFLAASVLVMLAIIGALIVKRFL